jgi:hypothetical protein
MLIEEPRQAVAIFDIERHNTCALQRPIVGPPGGDHLARVAGLEVLVRIISRDTCDAGDEER